MHAVAVDAVERLGHERGVQPVLLGDRLQRRAKGDGVIGRAHRVVVLEVDLVLPDSHFVVAGFDHDAQLLERFDHLLADVGGLVSGQVEVARLIVGQRFDARQTVVRFDAGAANHEELQLRTGHVAEAHVLGELDLPPQDAARIARERFAVRRVDVADDFGGAVVVAALPGDDAEGFEVRVEEHVAFVNAREALDTRAVEPQTVVDRVAELVERDMDVLDDAHDVGELQADEPYVGRLGLLEHALLHRSFVRRWHVCSFLMRVCCRRGRREFLALAAG